MQSSSPLLHWPSSPVPHQPSYSGVSYSHRPLNSSPLASPVVSSNARRRSQYKARTPNSTTPRASSAAHNPFGPRSGGGTGGLFGGGASGTASEDPQKVFLREKFKARCFERAARARAKAVRGKRYQASSEAGSDGFDEAMDDDEEEGEDDIMQDELFRRIMESSNRKNRHSYKVSYACEVGSSLDPDMEDIDTWHELADAALPPPLSSRIHTYSRPLKSLPVEELTPEDLDDEELRAYAEECYAREEFADIPEEDLFGWSDLEDTEEAARQLLPRQSGDDVDMDMEAN